MENKYNFDEMTLDEAGKFIDNATERESILYNIYEEEPEVFNEKGDSLLSQESCKDCGEKTVYAGPNVSYFENGRCMRCGELQVK